MEVTSPNFAFEPDECPEGWTICHLAEVGTWYSGGTPRMSVASYWSGEIPWVSPKDMKVSRLHDSIDHISTRAVSDGARIVPKGTVLMVIRGMILAHSFPVARAEKPLAFNQDIKAVVTKAEVDSNFVLYWLTGNAQKLRGLTTESTHGTKRLPLEMLFRVPFPHPPKPEQEAIAEALGDVDALIESLERLLAKKRDLKRGAMQELLRPRDGWTPVKLGELGRFTKGSGIKKDEAASGDLPCVRYGEIYTRHSEYVKSFFSWVSPPVAAKARRLQKGDLLFAGSGETKEEIGKCVALVDDIEAYAGGDIVILRTEGADAMFLGYYLNTAPINRQKASRGQGDAVVHITAGALAELGLIIPSTVEEQAAIAEVFRDMDAEIAALEERLAKARHIKLGMMQELLTGRIRLL